jgi:hypothetical protein
LCCVVLCCVVLCCVVLCCVVLCCVVLCGVVLCGVVWCCVVSLVSRAAGAQSAARTEQPDHGEEAEHDGDHGARDPPRLNETCPVSTGGGTRLVRLVREEGRGVSSQYGREEGGGMPGAARRRGSPAGQPGCAARPPCPHCAREPARAPHHTVRRARLGTTGGRPASAPHWTGPPRRPSGGAAPRPAVSACRERAHGAVGDERPARCERAAAEPREPAHAARHGRDDGERAEVPRAYDDGAVRDDPHEREQDRVPAPKDRGPGRGVRLSARAEGGGGGVLRF